MGFLFYVALIFAGEGVQGGWSSVGKVTIIVVV